MIEVSRPLLCLTDIVKIAADAPIHKAETHAQLRCEYLHLPAIAALAVNKRIHFIPRGEGLIAPLRLTKLNPVSTGLRNGRSHVSRRRLSLLAATTRQGQERGNK